eukprot:gb/GECG01005252.1/.p1 GENE.gb/GECG01005252.1/~~gb/GECG01005252.1/.p1  ORF type:complete len:447 (+),score=54.97 gb/GECG01005252.1/:1-1341(+)
MRCGLWETMLLKTTLVDEILAKLYHWRILIQATVVHILIIWFLRPLLGRAGVPLAPCPGDTAISQKWLEKVLRKNKVVTPNDRIQEVKSQDLAGNRGFAGGMADITVKLQGGRNVYLILKMARTSTISERYQSMGMGQFREGRVYTEFSKELQDILPDCYYSFGSSITGDSVMLMENLQKRGVGANHYFGNQTWGAKALTDEEYEKPEIVLESMFTRFADIHAKYWCKPELKQHPWLKGADWYRGTNKTKWLTAVKASNRMWEEAKAKMKTSGVNWSEKLIDIIDRSFEATTWENLQKRLNDPEVPFTFTHGDFHAANMIWLPKEKRPIAVDWSEVGVWEPAAELGQSMISDIRREWARKHEKELVRKYWKRLTSRGVSPQKYTFEKCWHAYELGGAEKWVFMIAVMSSFPIPAEAMQYFHDQLLGFIEDHGDYPAYPLTTVVTLM